MDTKMKEIARLILELIAEDMRREDPRGLALMQELFNVVAEAFVTFGADTSKYKKIVLLEVMPSEFADACLLTAQRKGL